MSSNLYFMIDSRKTYDDEMMKNKVIIDINLTFEVNIIKLSFDIKFKRIICVEQDQMMMIKRLRCKM